MSHNLPSYWVVSWGTPQFFLFINYHLHVHVFMTEGGQDKKGKFHSSSALFKFSRNRSLLLGDILTLILFFLMISTRLLKEVTEPEVFSHGMPSATLADSIVSKGRI